MNQNCMWTFFLIFFPWTKIFLLTQFWFTGIWIKINNKTWTWTKIIWTIFSVKVCILIHTFPWLTHFHGSHNGQAPKIFFFFNEIFERSYFMRFHKPRTGVDLFSTWETLWPRTKMNLNLHSFFYLMKYRF